MTREIALPFQGKSKMDDNRVVVTLHAIECRQCEWATGVTEDQGAVYEALDVHQRDSRHKDFWHYQIQRGQGHTMWLPA